MNWIKLEPITIPVLLQSVAALVAVIAGSVGFIRLFKKSAKNEKSIASLSDIAEQLQNQNSIMADGNQSQEKMLVKLGEILARGQDIQKSDIEFQEIKRKNEIKPFFIFAEGGADRETWYRKIVNKGKGPAYYKKVDIISIENGATINRPKEIRVAIGENIEFTGAQDRQNRIVDIPEFEIKLLFQDENGNSYEQIMKNTLRERISNPPVEIS